MSKEKAQSQKFYVHLVSDATGTTLLGLSRAVLAQFEDIDPNQKFWPKVEIHCKLFNRFTYSKSII